MGTDKITAEMIQLGGRTMCCEIQKLMNSIWNRKLTKRWKESIIVPTYKKGDETDCSNYAGMSLLLTTCKILSTILLSRLTPHAGQILGNFLCGFQHNRSSTDHLFWIFQILQKKWEYGVAVHQLFIDFKKAYDSVRKEVFYNNLTEFGKPKLS